MVGIYTAFFCGFFIAHSPMASGVSVTSDSHLQTAEGEDWEGPES